ncbi:MAG TPA: helix-turn-helix domain-containing protein, partial [Fibrobacteria bacterium]|nr:helix-turn-helix domain-containing protein [Fibrobacteria bacterium]
MRSRDPSKESAIRRMTMELAVKEGFDGLSMQKVAKAAKVSPGTLYIYFEDREDLMMQAYKA